MKRSINEAMWVLRFVMIVVVAIMATACGSTTRSVEMHDTERSTWSTAEVFHYDNHDTLTMRDIAIVVRYDKGYLADSVPMRILCLSPDSLVVEERFTLHIPHLGDMHPAEHTFPYRSHVVLGRVGHYTFRLTPDHSVEGIESIGIAISEPESEE